jgi:hypothetical protein
MTLPRYRIPGAIAAVLLVVTATAGCFSPEPETLDEAYPAFAEPQDELDPLPTDFDSLDLAGYDLDSSRYAGTDGTTKFYILTQTVDDGSESVCLAALSPNGPMVGCSPNGALKLTNPGVFEAQLVQPPAPDIVSWRAISDYVLVTP